MKNKKNTHCCWCGKSLPVGEGIAFFVEEGDEMLGFGPFGATGWMAECENRDECKGRVEKEKEERTQKREEKERIENLKEQLFPLSLEHHGGFQEDGIRLDGIEYMFEGEGRNIYGGGEWFVVTETEIWRVQNNGMDGDDWSRNNIRTGGAGAIGYVYEKTDERIEYLEKYAVNETARREKEREEEKKREIKRENEIRRGLIAMKNRGITFEMVEGEMKSQNTDTFCPRELTKNGNPLYSITLAEAKRILE